MLRGCVIKCPLYLIRKCYNAEYNRDVSHPWEGCPQVMKSEMCHEQPVELDGDEIHEEPTPKRAGKRTEKAGTPAKKKKKPLVAAKVPPVKVYDNGRRKIIVLNVLALLCDITRLHDRREWRPDLVIHHNRDLNVKKKIKIK